MHGNFTVYSNINTDPIKIHCEVSVMFFIMLKQTVHTVTKLNSVSFSPQANYTDRATAACRRS
jgi:hypothetical protein